MAENNTNALATVSTNEANIGNMYCSIVPTGNRADDARIFAALNSPEFKLADFINKKLKITDVLVKVVQLVDEDTGEMDVVPQVVLIDTDGKSYQATSKGIFNALQSAYTVFGKAPWNPALEIEIKQRAVKKGSMLTFNVVG